jgi:hypothetical protein
MCQSETSNATKTVPDLRAFQEYLQARKVFLHSIGFPDSRRDPLVVLSEWIAQSYMGGELAKNPVQKGYDLITADERQVQVKSCSNPAPIHSWLNPPPCLDFRTGIDDYAIVFFEAFEFKALIVFPRETIEQVYDALRKRHPNRGFCLQLTQQNFRQLISEQAYFSQLGVQIYTPTTEDSA